MVEGHRQARTATRVVRRLVLVGGLATLAIAATAAAVSGASLVMVAIATLVLAAIAIVHVRAFIRAGQGDRDSQIGSDGKLALILTTCLCFYSLGIAFPALDLRNPMLIPGVGLFIVAAWLVNRSVR